MNNIVGTLFLDLSKAFVLLNPANLLHILSRYGLHNNTLLDWFKTYLISRTQNTFISGEQSTTGRFCPRSDTIFDLHQ